MHTEEKVIKLNLLRQKIKSRLRKSGHVIRIVLKQRDIFVQLIVQKYIVSEKKSKAKCEGNNCGKFNIN